MADIVLSGKHPLSEGDNHGLPEIVGMYLKQEEIRGETVICALL
jgi:hypothetical protein